MDRRTFLNLTVAAAGAALLPRLARADATRPNFLLLVSDEARIASLKAAIAAW